MSQPKNINFLSPIAFRFQIEKLPNTNFFVQNVDVPSVAIGDAPVASQYLNYSLAGGQVRYDPLTITIGLDTDFNNYFEIYEWIQGLAGTYSGPHYDELIAQDGQPYSDAQLIILTSSNEPNIKFTFIDTFPTGLGQISFNSTLSDVEYVTTDITFNYKYFTVERIKS